ncbi:MAG: Cof-type HAD-IIB family hydrolase [Mobilicoccus sp.]|nr:Cof-type HAD-IIB family hydrolase [Mobilicoccus sp.]
MSTSPALIAVDIDGTLLTRRGLILPGTRAEFARARAAGATILLASGRPVGGLRRLAERLHLPTDGLVFAGSNGSVTVEATSGDVIARTSLDHDLVLRMTALTAEHGILTMLCDGDDLVVDQPDHPQVRIELAGNGLGCRPVADLRTLAPGEARVDKLLMYGHPDQLRPFSTVFIEEFGEEVEHAFSAPFYFEATALGVDKGSALAALAADRGVDVTDSVAFGDNGNDIPLLRAAGVGVAMGNAIEETKAAADRVTASNENEGIAAVLADLYGDGDPAPPVEAPDVEPMYHREVDLTSDDSAFILQDPPQDPHHSGGDGTRGRP